jgi:hypothetical protein
MRNVFEGCGERPDVSPARRQSRAGRHLRVDVARNERGAWQVQALIQTRSGVNPRVQGAGLGSNGFVILSEGFLIPPLQEWVHADGSRAVLDEQPPVFDASMLRVETARRPVAMARSSTSSSSGLASAQTGRCRR